MDEALSLLLLLPLHFVSLLLFKSEKGRQSEVLRDPQSILPKVWKRRLIDCIFE